MDNNNDSMMKKFLARPSMSKRVKNFSVTSLEYGRVNLIQKNGISLVSKKTTIKEHNNLTRTKKWLKKNGDFLGHKTGLCFDVSVPKIVEWKEADNILVMEYCRGVNLEAELMKNNRNRSFYINLISDLLHWVKIKSFYWQDFAPRNILFDEENLKVTLIDFESNLKIGNKPMLSKNFNFFLQNRIILELSTVLFPEEQKYLCPNIWKYTKHTLLPLDEVNGRRRRKYILWHHPKVHKIKHADLVQIERQIVSIATPFYNKKQIYYPLHQLSKINSPEKYIETILILEKSEKKYWPKIIKRAVNSKK